MSPVLVKSNDDHDPDAILYNPVAVNNSDAIPVVTVIYAINETVVLLLKLIPVIGLLLTFLLPTKYPDFIFK